MSSNSSISSSDSAARSEPAQAAFARRAFRFALPYALVALVSTFVFLRSGEVIPARFVAWATTLGIPFVYLNEFSDHSYRFKLDAAQLRRPEILAIGGSRINQWRSAMFRPYTFFSAANCLYGQGDYRRFLEDLGDSAPRVLMFSFDFYTFNPGYEAFFKHVAYGEIGGIGSPELGQILRSLLKRAAKRPVELWPFQSEPLHGVPALGLHAARTGTGFRIDGSYQYGAIILGLANAGAATIEDAVGRVAKGTVPFLASERMDTERVAEVERFAAAAKQRGITLVALTMPYAPDVFTALQRSGQHGIFHQFHGAETSAWLARLGILHFDFSRLESFGGKPEEFVDPFHPTETAYLRMLLVMLKNERFAALVPKLDRGELERRLASATRFEVYKNEF